MFQSANIYYRKYEVHLFFYIHLCTEDWAPLPIPIFQVGAIVYILTEVPPPSQNLLHFRGDLGARTRKDIITFRGFAMVRGEHLKDMTALRALSVGRGAKLFRAEGFFMGI